jgi:hypothetical protein
MKLTTSATLNTLAIGAAALLLVNCSSKYEVFDSGGYGPGSNMSAKTDGFDESRSIEVLLTAPFCDVCTMDDKAYLKANSAITARVINLLDSARERVDIAQFTFSVRDIEEAILRAHHRGVQVRVAMNNGQSFGDTVSTRLKAAGVNVRFIAGRPVNNQDYSGLMHAKFMIVDTTTLLTGSNNWSSTGTSINNENTLVIQATATDPLLVGFACHFKSIWSGRLDEAVRCSNDQAAFTPGASAIGLLKNGIREAELSIDVLMHHLLFTDLVKELAKAAERGVQVRIILNAGDQAEAGGSAWNRLLSAGGLVRFKKTNTGAYQFMHHKLAIIDNRVVLNGSGNWSGSAFFNNYENFVRYDDVRISTPFIAAFKRLWQWSLTADSLDDGMTAAQQHTKLTQVYFGNLHAHHYAVSPSGELLDDGKLELLGDDGTSITAVHAIDGTRYAYEYARDHGQMDFMALSPHCMNDSDEDGANVANMSTSGYEHVLSVARQITDESIGGFVAIPAMEWSTNSLGNHVNIFGSEQVAKTMRGRFDLLYDEFLPSRAKAGDQPIIQYNHPRTFRRGEGYLTGNWDQIFDVNLSEIPKNSQRTKKFNDYGLDDYYPMSAVRDNWINGGSLPDRSTVRETLANVELAARPFVRLMEVTVGRGKELGTETPVNPSIFPNPEGVVERFTRVHSDWDYYLLNGFRMAPTAPHDNHFANWGTAHTCRTAIVAPMLTESALLDGMDSRSVYATEDENLTVRFYAEGRVPMGSELTTLSDSVTLNLHVSDPDYWGSLSVTVHYGTVGGEEVTEVHNISSVPSDQWIEIPLSISSSGVHFAYLAITQTDLNRMTWTAPIWVRKL